MITLATLDQATAQEVFTQVKDHLLKQNERSLSPTGDDNCAYRGADGKKCAAGCLMTDKEASTITEGKTWDSLVLMGKVRHFHHDLISDLQRIHDQYSDVEDWPELLQNLAYKYNLKY
jgi:hypothetical protein